MFWSADQNNKLSNQHANLCNLVPRLFSINYNGIVNSSINNDVTELEFNYTISKSISVFTSLQLTDSVGEGEKEYNIWSFVGQV